MDIPGVDAVAFRLPYRLNTKIGNGDNPIHLENQVPYVVIAEQGITGARRDELAIAAGPAGLHADVPADHALIHAPDQIELPGEETKPRKIDHIVICLDISSTMSRPCETDNGTSKLEHIQNTIIKFIHEGIPEDTPTTLVIYDQVARVANDKNASPVEFTTNLKTLYETILNQRTGWGTNFFDALDVTSQKIQEFNDNDNSKNTLLVFITDGKWTFGPEGNYILEKARELRGMNVHTIIIGTGKNYDPEFLRRLSTEIGPTMNVHTPRSDAFGIFAPVFASDIRNQHYMSVIARKFSPGLFFDSVPSIKPAADQFKALKTSPGANFRLWGGYQTQIIGIGFADADYKFEPNFRLLLHEHASGTGGVHEIPIHDLSDPGQYERAQEAMDAYARILAWLAQQRWSAKDFDEIVKTFPGAFNSDDAAEISQMLHTDQRSLDQNDVRATVANADMSETANVSAYRQAVNDFSAIAGQDADESSISHPSVRGQAGQDDFAAGHSGAVGRFDAPPGEVGELHLRPDAARAYDYNVQLVKITGPDEVPSRLDFQIGLKGSVTLGRGINADVKIADPNASRVHCSIFEKDGKLWIKDEKSSNGTFVNYHQITESELNKTERIQIGTTIFRIHY